MAITDFLELNISKEELSITLRILHAFKEQESIEEWVAIPFAAWAKLEQFEEFLEYLVNNKPLKPDTIRYIAKMKSSKELASKTDGYHEVYMPNSDKAVVPEPPSKVIEPTKWKPTATDVTCKFFKCEGCHEQPRPTPCDRWHFFIVYYVIRLFNWR